MEGKRSSRTVKEAEEEGLGVEAGRDVLACGFLGPVGAEDGGRWAEAEGRLPRGPSGALGMPWPLPLKLGWRAAGGAVVDGISASVAIRSFEAVVM